MANQVTLRDIAKKSGYSMAAVSLALRNKPGVSEATRRHIMEIAQKLGYPLKDSAETGPPPTPRNLGLIIKTEPEKPPRANPFYSRILAGIEDACRQKESNLLYARLPVDTNNYPAQIPPLLSNGELDGLLVVGVYVDDTITARIERYLQIPVVLVDAYAVNEEYDAVLPDNFVGAYAAVTYLIDKNHRHIGMLGGCQSNYPGLKERRRGYEQALRDRGISDVYLTRCTLQPDEAAQATQELLEANPQVTAIFGSNDEVSIAAIHAARKMGREVPEQLSVIGFDDIELARYVTPSLTTMRIDKVMMGREAVRLLHWRLENTNAAHVTITVHSPLMERASVGPYRKASESLSKVKAKG